MFTFPTKLNITVLHWIMILSVVFHISIEVTITGSGTSFAQEVYKLWQASYIVSRQSYVTVEMNYNAIGARLAKEELYDNVNIEYISNEVVISDTEQNVHADLVEFPVVAGYVVSKS